MPADGDALGCQIPLQGALLLEQHQQGGGFLVTDTQAGIGLGGAGEAQQTQGEQPPAETCAKRTADSGHECLSE